MKEITVLQALDNGIYTRHSDMENGQLRYRLIGKDNSSYIRTEAHENCWENGHFHEFCHEMYILQSGTAFVCELKNDELSVQKLSAGDSVEIMPNVEHNIYMCANAIMHTVKFGNCVENDWNESKKIQALTHKLSLGELNNLGENTNLRR